MVAQHDTEPGWQPRGAWGKGAESCGGCSLNLANGSGLSCGRKDIFVDCDLAGMLWTFPENRQL
jgi:hypothetical protein